MLIPLHIGSRWCTVRTYQMRQRSRPFLCVVGQDAPDISNTPRARWPLSSHATPTSVNRAVSLPLPPYPSHATTIGRAFLDPPPSNSPAIPPVCRHSPLVMEESTPLTPFDLRFPSVNESVAFPSHNQLPAVLMPSVGRMSPQPSQSISW